MILVWLAFSLFVPWYYGVLIGAWPAMKLFFSTEPAPCPYLPDRRERRLVTVLDGAEPDALHDRLMRAGFRRSQGLRLSAGCPGCTSCVPVRIPVARFRYRRPWRRILRGQPGPRPGRAPGGRDPEQYELFRRYLAGPARPRAAWPAWAGASSGR